MKKNGRGHKKAGMIPGTVIYTGSKSDELILVEQYCYNETSFTKKEIKNISEIKFKENYINWINIDGVHNVDLVKNVGDKFGIDNLIQEDITNINQRPKIEERKNFIYIVIRMYRFEEKTSKIISEQVSMIIGENYLITFQEEPGDVFENIRARIEDAQGKIRSKGSDYLAYAILDAIVDNYFIILEKIESQIDELEDRLISKNTKDDLKIILNLKQDFNILKRGVIPLRDLATRLSNSRELFIFKENMRPYLNDLNDHIIITYEILENISAKVYGLVELYHSTVNSIMNETMRFLTIVSTIFVPLTFLAGIYGMNFENMPELRWHLGYFILLGIMGFTAIIMVYLFKRKRWF